MDKHRATPPMRGMRIFRGKGDGKDMKKMNNNQSEG